MGNKATVLVTGAGGFIGHHLVKYLVKRGHVVRGADVKAPEYQNTDANEFVIADLRNYSDCLKVTKNIDEVYHLAADMGGIGYISSSHASITLINTLINVHTLRAARANGTTGAEICVPESRTAPARGEANRGLAQVIHFLDDSRKCFRRKFVKYSQHVHSKQIRKPALLSRDDDRHLVIGIIP